MIYAGIGSRQTPTDILQIMRDKARDLALSGWTLRSGGADGADSAFEEGCKSVNGKSEIYLPWENFNGNTSKEIAAQYDPAILKRAAELSQHYHPNWDNLSDPVKLLMIRNAFQVLGSDLKTPSHYVLCWTVGGKVNGGTGQALRIAKDYNIKIINFFGRT